MTVASNGVFSSYGTVTSYTSPVLTIGISGNNVLIFWPASAPAGAVLQQSPDLNTWTNSTAAIVTNGANNTVTIMPQGAVEFYRLAY
jgi:hypothetical protein